MTKDFALTAALGAIELHLLHHVPGCVYLESVVPVIRAALAQPDVLQSHLDDAQEIIQRMMKERNFCHRCGKRLLGPLGPVSLHTCCPPNARTFDDYGNKIV